MRFSCRGFITKKDQIIPPSRFRHRSETAEREVEMEHTDFTEFESAEGAFSSALLEELRSSLAKGFCPACGKTITKTPRGRQRVFCSDSCRILWKSKHPQVRNWNTGRKAICPVCGKEFMAYREYGNKRKYCSRACANKGRAMKINQGEQRDE